jgi:phosphate transport system substrate-binding protein
MTWILAYQHQRDAVKGKKLVDFLTWAYTHGEAEAASLDYAPLPAELSTRLKERLRSIDIAGAR